MNLEPFDPRDFTSRTPSLGLQPLLAGSVRILVDFLRRNRHATGTNQNDQKRHFLRGNPSLQTTKTLGVPPRLLFRHGTEALGVCLSSDAANCRASVSKTYLAAVLLASCGAPAPTSRARLCGSGPESARDLDLKVGSSLEFWSVVCLASIMCVFLLVLAHAKRQWVIVALLWPCLPHVHAFPTGLVQNFEHRVLGVICLPSSNQHSDARVGNSSNRTVESVAFCRLVLPTVSKSVGSAESKGLLV